MVFLELQQDSRVTTGNSGSLSCCPREVQSPFKLRGGGVFLFILAALGFHYCVGFSLVVVSGGYSLVVVHTLLTAVGFPVGKHRL